MLLRLLMLLAVCAFATPASAQEVVEIKDPATLEHPSAPIQSTQFHLFISQGLVLTTGGNHYITRNPSLTEAALNVTQTFENVSFGAQLYARVLGDANIRPAIDWAQVTYRPYESLSLKAGRIKIPFGLYNEGVDIDAARVSALLPGSVYPDDLRTLLLSLNGGEVGTITKLDRFGELEVRLYAGTFSLPNTIPNARPTMVTIGNAKADYVVGGRLLWKTPIDGLTLAGSLQRVRYEIRYDLKPDFLVGVRQLGLVDDTFNGQVNVDFPINRWVVSADYQIGNLNLVGEYGRWHVDLGSSTPTLLPRGGPTNERFYLMGNYRLSEWFTTGAYYSVYYVDVSNRSGRAQQQHDIAGTLRFDITQNLLLKMEGHLMQGTAGLDATLNNNQDLNSLNQTWGLFVVKATAYF